MADAEDPAALEEIALAAVAAGAAVALGWRERAADLAVQEKAASDDLVSQADREAEAAILAVLARRAPGDGVLGEESGDAPGTTGVRWAVDPVDGTTNYLYARPEWAVSVAALDVRDGRILAGAVAEPALGRTTSACLGGGCRSDGRPIRRAPSADLSRALVEVNLGVPEQRALSGRLLDALVGRVRDVRRGGSAAAALAQVATGRAEAYWGPGLHVWDAAAGVLLVTEAGGVVGDLGGPLGAVWPPGGDVLAAADGLFEPLRELLAPVYPAA